MSSPMLKIHAKSAWGRPGTCPTKLLDDQISATARVMAARATLCVPVCSK